MSFQVIFCSFGPLLNPRIKIWKKCEKTPGYIILLHMCTINQDHMMHGSWDTKCNRHNLIVILGNFLPFYPPKSPKNENIKNEKNLEISSFYPSVPKIMIICYTFPEIWPNRCNCYFLFWAIFSHFTPITAHKIKISKKWKMSGDIIILHMCTKYYD